jgi:hypothetical protein
MRSPLPLVATLYLAACASTSAPPAREPALEIAQNLPARAEEGPRPSPRKEVEVLVPCKVKIPQRPAWPLDDPALAGKDIYMQGRAAIAEIELRRAYEARLEAALQVCTRTSPK